MIHLDCCLHLNICIMNNDDILSKNMLSKGYESFIFWLTYTVHTCFINSDIIKNITSNKYVVKKY